MDKSPFPSFSCPSPSSTLPHRQSAQHVESLRSEVDVLLAVRGLPCVVRVEQVVEEPHAVHVVMEACGQGDLFDYIAHSTACPSPTPPASSGTVHSRPSFPVLSAHPQGFHLPGAEARGRVGSSYYMAPEVVRGGRYGLPADVWSLGVILYIMLSGFVPFWGATSLQTFDAICSGRLDLSSPVCLALSPAAKALLRAMLSLDPAARPTAHQVLSHPWLSVNKTAVEAPQKSLLAHPWVPEHEVDFETPQNPVKPDLGKGLVETSPGKGVSDMGLGKGLVDRGGVLALDGMGDDCMGDNGVEGDAAGVWGCQVAAERERVE
ncbi:unnamed protein product [Closterium sp. Naga37s-1]|nr:unnamed protein product [Closterium sp. Naga37s-1]